MAPDLDVIQRQAEEQWERDAALRAEFCDNRAACIAYLRAEASGHVRVLRRPRDYASAASRAAARVPQSAGTDNDDAIAERWDRNAANCRDEFPDLAAYTAFERANAAGRIKVMGGKVKTWNQPEKTPMTARSTEDLDNRQPSGRENRIMSVAELRASMSDTEFSAYQRERWDSRSGLRLLFTDFDAFFSFCKTGSPKPSARSAS